MMATLVFGCALYRPWVSAPFDILDFSEFIPRLATAQSPADGFGRLFEYYLGHGRVNPVVYFATVVKWAVFEDWTPGWQGVRVLLFMFVVREAYLLYRKLGATWRGAALASAVFFVAPTASPGWVRLSVAEPLGVLFVLRASNLAIDARGGTASRSASLQMAALVLLLGLTKEMMLACLIIPAALYWWPVPAAERRSMAQRLRVLMPAVVTASVTSAIVIWGYLQRDSTAYASEYGTTGSAPWEIIPPWLFSFFPYDPFIGSAGVLFTVLTIGYVCVLAVGWHLHFRMSGAERSRESKAWLILALLFPALIALEYLPWPDFNRFYYLPALITLGGLIAIAASGLDRAGGRARWSTAAVLIACFAAGAAQTRAASDRAIVFRSVNAVLMRYLGSVSGVDTFYVGASAPGWKGLAETLRRYGPVVGVQLPPFAASECEEGEAAALDPSRAVGYIGFASLCTIPASATRTLSKSYPRFDLASLRLVPDSFRVDVIVRPSVLTK